MLPCRRFFTNKVLNKRTSNETHEYFFEQLYMAILPVLNDFRQDFVVDNTAAKVMGSKQTKQEVQENGVVNSNFIVQKQEYNVNKNVKIILYLIVVLLVINLGLKLWGSYRRQMKRRIRREVAASNASISAV